MRGNTGCFTLTLLIFNDNCDHLDELSDYSKLKALPNCDHLDELSDYSKLKALPILLVMHNSSTVFINSFFSTFFTVLSRKDQA